MKNGIEIAGSIIVDNIREVKRFPSQGELVTIDRVLKAVGGLVANDAIDIKKIDPSIDVLVSAKIGDDENGEFLKQTLTNFSLSLENLKTTSKPTSFTEVISVIGGQRTFLNYTGAADDFGFEDISFDYSMIHLGYFTLLKKIDDGDGLKILKCAKEKGIITSIDMISNEKFDYSPIVKCLPYVDNLIINEFEAGRLLNEKVDSKNLIQSAKNLKKLGVINRVIIHMPEKCCCVTDNETIELNSLKLDSDLIIGATGAGDAFCSGCLVGIYHNYSNKEILKLATSIAASSLLGADATSSIISLSETENFYNKYKR